LGRNDPEEKGVGVALTLTVLERGIALPVASVAGWLSIERSLHSIRAYRLLVDSLGLLVKKGGLSD